MRWAQFEPVSRLANATTQPIGQIIITGATTGLLIILIYLQRPVPQELWSTWLLIVGFYFGLGTRQAARL